VVLRDAGDHLLDEDGLADARTTEEADLSTRDVGRQQVDDLDARLEHLGLRLELVEGRGLAVDPPALVDLEPLALLEVEHVAGRVEDVAEGHVADGHADRGARVAHGRAADQAVGRLQRDGPDDAVADVLGDLEREHGGVLADGHLDLELVVDLGHGVDGELHVDDRADDTGDAARARSGGLVNRCSHCLGFLVSWVLSRSGRSRRPAR